METLIDRIRQNWRCVATALAAESDPTKSALWRLVNTHPDLRIRNLIFCEAHLYRGEFSLAWPYFLQKMEFDPGRQVTFPSFVRWGGEDISGKRLLVMDEWGLGDAIFAVRCLPMLRSRGVQVIYKRRPELSRLFRGIPGVLPGEPSQADTEADAYAFLMDLPFLLAETGDLFSQFSPYLIVDNTPNAEVQRLRTLEGLKVGIVWKAGPTGPTARSCQVMDFSPLAACEGVRLFSLQCGEAAEDAQQLPGLVRLDHKISDMADTAALIMALDLVVTVDTSVAHLAGALGKPVWVVLNPCSDWRWFLKRDDSPWYPTMRLFRQDAAGDFTSVLARVAESLIGVQVKKI